MVTPPTAPGTRRVKKNQQIQLSKAAAAATTTLRCYHRIVCVVTLQNDTVVRAFERHGLVCCNTVYVRRIVGLLFSFVVQSNLDTHTRARTAARALSETPTHDTSS